MKAQEDLQLGASTPFCSVRLRIQSGAVTASAANQTISIGSLVFHVAKGSSHPPFSSAFFDNAMRVNLRLRSNRRRIHWKHNLKLALAAAQRARMVAEEQQADLQHDIAGHLQRIVALEAELAEANQANAQHHNTINDLHQEIAWAAVQHEMARRAAKAAVHAAQAEAQEAQKASATAEKARRIAQFFYTQAEEDCDGWKKDCLEAREESKQLRGESQQLREQNQRLQVELEPYHALEAELAKYHVLEEGTAAEE